MKLLGNLTIWPTVLDHPNPRAPHFFGLKPAPVRKLLKTHIQGKFLLQYNREKSAFIFNKSWRKKLHLCTNILNDSDLLKQFIYI